MVPQPSANTNVLKALIRVLAERRTASPDESYVARLYHQGPERIREKLAEESAELVAAVAGSETERAAHVIHEAADLLFHTLVLLTWAGVTLEEVESELNRRFGISGLKPR